MTKVWSFNTTVRNPERMENMLRALSTIEGKKFDRNGQKLFFGAMIKKRMYKPVKRTLEEPDLINAVHGDTTGEEIEDSIVDNILSKFEGQPVDASGRGRTPAGILNRFGLCIALQSREKVVITDLAKDWLEGKVDEEELFTKFLLKWQYPNPIEKGYSGFDIKPFVGTLSLITEVNKKWMSEGNDQKGISKIEYQLFIPSLIRHDQIQDYVDRIVNFRNECKNKTGVDRSEYIKTFKIKRIREIFGDNVSIEGTLDKLKDYTDSSIRYFRMSGLIGLRGGDTHVDISKDKTVEVNSILDNISLDSKNYTDHEEYFNYLNNINSLELPWLNNIDFEKISNELLNILKEEMDAEGFRRYNENISALNNKDKVEELRSKVNKIRINKLKEVKYNFDVLDDCIDKLTLMQKNNYSPLTSRPSLDFEWYVSRALLVINDAINISPSFKMGDDGLPTGFRANVSDIECFYESFNMIVEVTLLSGRDQWYAEGQPVMQHLRDFEDVNTEKNNYCIFVAPFIHRGTLNTFWGSINGGGYEGGKQRILPITMNQFIEILNISRKKIVQGGFSNVILKDFLEYVINKSKEHSVSNEWLDNIPNYIKTWSED